MTCNAHALSDSVDLSGSCWKTLNECALWIHGCADFPTLQTGLLDAVNKVIGHRASMFDIAQAGAHGQTEFVSPAGRGMTQKQLDTYYDRYAAFDYTVWSFDVHNVNVYRDLDLVDVERRNATPIYQEWMEPLDIYFGCTATLAHEGVPLGSLTLFREKEAGEFSDEELEMLRQIARHLSLRLHQVLPDDSAQNTAKNPLETLIAASNILPREAEVLRLMLAGKTNREIATELYISESTVKKHINAVYHKLSVKNRLGLVALLQA